ncbi:eukaryotic translation initiation factor 5 [Histoplasma capsulatum H143]|uniref:Eukaryotic translation initiation factor 5 n=1 Tax=Ajellomyces capsulatus (strain H143) TaxID=544712 RepID=C6H4D6_AJECH|nr:eukaryotic translation initiation factor 5 [Histoplasma capsulatum H143]
MATTVNIRRDNPDPFYRYKMERLQAKIEGKGNGIKTVVVNLNNVAQSLGRPPAYLIKYFGFELGAQANAKPTDDRWIINGAHDASKLQDYLDGFIVKFVLCKKCKNPETEVVVKEPRIILDCKACGERSDVDLRQKLSSFILKNQPKKGKKDKSTKKSRRERNKGKGDGETNGEANGESNGSPAKELGIESKHKTLAVLAQTMFDDKIVKQIPSRAGMLKKMITSERHEKAFLGGTERLVGIERPNLCPSVPAILLAYYQEDLISEEVLKAWGSKASKKYVDIATSRKVRKAAEKFIEWLETAESDEDDDED